MVFGSHTETAAMRELEWGCACGQHASAEEHEAAGERAEVLSAKALRTAAIRALFPKNEDRRRFLGAVGAPTTLAAISTLLPFGALEAMAQEKGAIEKKDLKIGFIPITCASPLIMPTPLGFYENKGANDTRGKT